MLCVKMLDILMFEEGVLMFVVYCIVIYCFFDVGCLVRGMVS